MYSQTKREYAEKYERRTKARKKKAKDYREQGVLVNSMGDGNVLYSYTSKINQREYVADRNRGHQEGGGNQNQRAGRGTKGWEGLRLA